MKHLKGMHFYINVENYNDIVADEEKKTNSVTHSIHALDTFFSVIERFSKERYPKTSTIEKVTGSRLHIYVCDEILPAYNAAKTVSVFAYKLAKYLNKEISKYKTLLDFSIQVGCAYGEFYDFEFSKREYSETTTIGYAANFAAKLQSRTEVSRIGISKDIYDALGVTEQCRYDKKDDSTLKKYNQNCYYSALLSELKAEKDIDDADIAVAKEYASSTNLGDIQYSEARQLVNFNDVSKTQCKKLQGIPVFADIRGFTEQFDSDDKNLDEMARKTQNVLEMMYNITINHGGAHVQFQGDREMALYHHTVNNRGGLASKCFKSATLASMRLIDAVKGSQFKIHIGVGGDFGQLYATKIGARGEKDNLLLGETVINADMLEDRYAGEDQIAITKEVYDGLRAEDINLSNYFKPSDGAYIATVGYETYQKECMYTQQAANTKQNKYNGAWGELE